MDLKDRVALVTGGSRGLGRSIATQLSFRGAVTVICGRNEGDLLRTASSINKCYYFVADVSSFGDVQRMFLWMKEQFGRVDILVNNAGVGIYKPFIELGEEDFDMVMNVNVKGSFLCSLEGARAMRAQGGGCILNVLSGAAECGFRDLSVYCASKHALFGLTKCMTMELSQLGIEVVYVSPGYMKTGFFDGFPEDHRVPETAPSPDVVAEGIIKMLEGLPAKRGVREVIRGAKRRLFS
jgi:NAD(P)-dependent dehydrogenase (short-subunit alcohol dehydrogenase family)